jgi:putative transcriptional regulator
MKPRKNNPVRLGKRIGEALAELESAVRSGRPLAEQITIRTVEVAQPRPYNAADVRRTRDRLQVSQTVFAQLLGVSVELIEHWEQGIARPRPMARRLMDEINRDPKGFMSRQLTRPSPPRRVA